MKIYCWRNITDELYCHYSLTRSWFKFLGWCIFEGRAFCGFAFYWLSLRRRICLSYLFDFLLGLLHRRRLYRSTWLSNTHDLTVVSEYLRTFFFSPWARLFFETCKRLILNFGRLMNFKINCSINQKSIFRLALIN